MSRIRDDEYIDTVEGHTLLHEWRSMSEPEREHIRANISHWDTVDGWLPSLMMRLRRHNRQERVLRLLRRRGYDTNQAQP